SSSTAAPAPPPPFPYTTLFRSEGTCEASGSIIDCHNRTLGERLPVAGTPYTLNYRSDRVPGIASRPFEIPVTGAFVPDSMLSALVQVRVAGRHFARVFDPEPNQTDVGSGVGLDPDRKPVKRTAFAQVGVG